ncbi:MAG: aspartate aminotransferase family protein [Alphaproteobacteria bacterium]|nr:aspartate aminotransferase family protein [Alphaproteobacteria bacterium]
MEAHMNPTDWSKDGIVARREKYFAASQRAFVPYKVPTVFKRGSMQYLWDETGKRYLDLLGMNVCISVGHAHPKVTAAVEQQLRELPHVTTMFYHPVPAQFAEELAAKMPKGHDWVVHFTNSGAEAIDLALVMAQHATGNIDMIALRNAYHGTTIGAQSLTGIAGFRHHIPLLGGMHHVANPDPYRGAFGDDVDAYVAEVKATIRNSTSGRLAGFIAEPIQGYGGIVEALPGYIKRVAEITRAHGGIVIMDEVQSGFGRTGDHFWAFEGHDVVPEIVVMAKGIGNGFPLGAVVAQRHVAEKMAGKFTFHTYGANPMACAAGRAVLEVIDEEGTQANSAKVGAALKKVFERLHQKHEVVGHVRGHGLMMAIELVKDRKSKTPAPEITADVFEKSRDNGLVLSKSGANRNILRMVPPMCIQESDVALVEEALERSFAGY